MAVPLQRRRPRVPRGAAGTYAALLLMALGCVAVELAYAGRAGTGWGSPVYWTGELLLYGAAAYAVARRQASRAATLSVLLTLGLCTFVIKVAYSPLHFSFPDEFQHWRTLSDILRTHHLFHPNPALPVSPSYPGLEIATSAVVATTGLSVFVSGLAVSGFAHVLLIVLVFWVFRRVGASVRISGLAALVFATEPHFQYFDEIFAYQTVALPLFAFALLAGLTLTGPPRVSRNPGWWTAGVVAVAAVVVTHHVTTLALLFMLCAVAISGAIRWRLAPLLFAAASVSMAAAWMATKARGTFSYLAHPLEVDVLSAFTTGGGTSNAKGSGVPPLPDRILAYATVVVTLCLLGLGWREIWSRRRPLRAVPEERFGPRSRAGWSAMALAALAYPFTLGVRLFAADGSELAGRALTFALVPVAAFVAMVLLVRRTRSRWVEVAGVVATVLLLTAGGLVTGWPPWWERLPSTFRPASFERGIDPENIAAAVWAGSHLPAGQGVGGDFVATSLMGTYGRLIAVRNVAPLFYAREFRRIDASTVQSESIQYLAVDRRMTASLPAVGGYFADNPPALMRKRMPRRALDKFDRIPGIDRIYDNGSIVVYDLRGSRYFSG